MASGVRIGSSTNSSKWLPKVPGNDALSLNPCSNPKLATLPRRALLLIGSGTAIGLGLALLVGRLLQQILYGVQPTDPITYATVFLMILAIAAVACCVPAMRAIRINPVTALRQE